MSWTTCFRAIKGWLAGCGAATAVVVVLYMIIVANGAGSERIDLAGLAVAVLALTFVVTCLMSAIPAALVSWLSEKFAIRSILFFAGTGAAIGALSERVLLGVFGSAPSDVTLLFAGAGLAAGTAYWWIAGRHAGASLQSSGASP